MSAQIDYTTIAVISAASGFFGAIGAEFARSVIEQLKTKVKK